MTTSTAPGAATVNRTGLPTPLKQGVEALSGISLDNVKVHYNSAKPAQLQAHAYTQGSEIHLAHGQEKHLPHEAWHVVQQTQGRVRPTIQMKGRVPLNDDTSLEKEADIMGAKALQMKATAPVNGYPSLASGLIPCIQRKPTLFRPLTLDGIIKFLRQIIKEEGEVSIADQAAIAKFINGMSKSQNRVLYPIYVDLYSQAQYQEGGKIYKEIYESKKKAKPPSKKRKREKPVSDKLFDGNESEDSDGDVDIDSLYDKAPTIFQQAVDHSDFNQVKGSINPRNTNLLTLYGRSLIPSSINGEINTSARPKKKRKLAETLKKFPDNLRANQEQFFFGSHLNQGQDGDFNQSIEKLKKRAREGELSSEVKKLATTSRKGFTIVDTHGHAEQSLLRSKIWDALKKRLIERIKRSIPSEDIPSVDSKDNAILITLILNRSSCRGCGLALSLSLIEFWEQLAIALGEKLDWRAMRKKYASKVRFLVRFPTIYEYDKENKISFGNLKEVLASLIETGWEIAPIRPHIEGGLDSYNKLVEILKALEAFPDKDAFAFYHSGGAKTSEKSSSISPPRLAPVPSQNRVTQQPLRNFLSIAEPNWAQQFQGIPIGEIPRSGNQGFFANEIEADEPQAFFPTEITLENENRILHNDGLKVLTNSGTAALCFVFSVLMGLTGQSENDVRAMVFFIAERVGIEEGWINADSDTARLILNEVERIYGVQLDLVVVQQGHHGAEISGRPRPPGGQIVVIRQTDFHYDAYVSR